MFKWFLISISRRKTSLAVPTSDATSNFKYERQKGFDDSICKDVITEKKNEETFNESHNCSTESPSGKFGDSGEGNLCKPDMKICEEDEDLIEAEPTFECLEPQLIDAKLMIPEVCYPKQENFARFFDVKDIGKLKYSIKLSPFI